MMDQLINNMVYMYVTQTWVYHKLYDFVMVIWFILHFNTISNRSYYEP